MGSQQLETHTGGKKKGGLRQYSMAIIARGVQFYAACITHVLSVDFSLILHGPYALQLPPFS